MLSSCHFLAHGVADKEMHSHVGRFRLVYEIKAHKLLRRLHDTVPRVQNVWADVFFFISKAALRK